MHETLRRPETRNGDLSTKEKSGLPGVKQGPVQYVRQRKTGLDITAAWAAIGIFVILAAATVSFMAQILIPMCFAVVIGLILGLTSEKLVALGIPPLMTAILLTTALGLGVFLMAGALVDPMMELASRAPEIVRHAIERVTPMLERFPWLRMTPGSLSFGSISPEVLLQNTGSVLSIVSASLTPALLQTLIFFAALALFLSGRIKLRRMLILAFPHRHQRLSTIRVLNAIDGALGFYFATAALVYCGLGIIAAIIAFVAGLGNPLLWGLFAFLSSFVPFLGIAAITLAFGVAGLLTHETIMAGLAPAAAFFTVHLLMENLVMPAIMGRRLEVNPFLVFSAIIFWSWMWGAAGAMLALPISIIGMTIADELRPGRKNRPDLPG
ncbi:AI-2E family transporter [Sinorhizobium sp. BG8]|uniref:AI-2E family transporter n=1 Tax=Sinorhizobium sp. BG8 TaxID=2613773 RepID=UPI00193D01A9|nr:AI-2E family transporter [Sinorhizobium sp. BG8]QRM54683.1 AI-2E family transporter [Sinorhizobium sp. BG8]